MQAAGLAPLCAELDGRRLLTKPYSLPKIETECYVQPKLVKTNPIQEFNTKNYGAADISRGALQLSRSRYVGEVNFNRSRRLSIYGYAVIQQLRVGLAAINLATLNWNPPFVVSALLT